LTNLIQNFLIGGPGRKTIGIGRRKYTIGMYAKGFPLDFPQYKYVNSIFINKVLIFNAKVRNY